MYEAKKRGWERERAGPGSVPWSWEGPSFVPMRPLPGDLSTHSPRSPSRPEDGAPRGGSPDGVVFPLQRGRGWWRQLTSATSWLTCPLATTR